MVDLLGLDVGLLLTKPTSGICRTGESGLLLAHTYCDRLSRMNCLEPEVRVSVSAIDGPILPTGVLNYDVRPCEQVFTWGLFQRRCKPGRSDVAGTGQALRRAGCDTAAQVSPITSGNDLAVAFPRVQDQTNVVEAFPNAFLGVMVAEHVHALAPRLRRGEKFEWLLNQCRNGPFEALRDTLAWDDERLWHQLDTNAHHEEQAALVCALTAACVWAGKYIAVGESALGYFFLPPWETWQPWAKQALDENRDDPSVAADISIWISGTEYATQVALP